MALALQKPAQRACAGRRLRVDAGAVLHGHGHQGSLRDARPHRRQGRPARQQPEPCHARPAGRARGRRPTSSSPACTRTRRGASSSSTAGSSPGHAASDQQHDGRSREDARERLSRRAHRVRAEVARYCDAHDIDFYAVRDAVNSRLAQTDAASDDARRYPAAACSCPPSASVGTACPRTASCLWWRRLEDGADASRV